MTSSDRKAAAPGRDDTTHDAGDSRAPALFDPIDDHNEIYSTFPLLSDSDKEQPPPYAINSETCDVCPDRVAVWKLKKSDVFLSALAATVLVRDGALAKADLELLQPRERAESSDTGYTDPFSALAVNTYGTIREVLEGAAEGPLEAHRQLEKARMRKEAMQGTGSGPSSYETGDMVKSAIGTTAVDKDHVLFDSTAPQYPESSNTYSGLTPSNSTSATTETLRPDSSASPLDNPYAAVAVSTGKGVARIIGAGLKAPATYTHGLAQGFNNMPRLYGDDTVRKEEKIDGFGSGLVAAGKGLGYGLFDGITGLVAQPVRGVQEEGAAGFFKGFGKGLGGLVCKPAAGACGIPGYAFMGVYKSLASLKNDKPTLDDLVAAEYVAQGEQELRAVEETEKKRILDTWRALDLSQ